MQDGESNCVNCVHCVNCVKFQAHSCEVFLKYSAAGNSLRRESREGGVTAVSVSADALIATGCEKPDVPGRPRYVCRALVVRVSHRCYAKS